MMAVIWLDFTGTEDELKEVDKTYKQAAEKTKGAEYLGRYTTLTRKWNWGSRARKVYIAKFPEIEITASNPDSPKLFEPL
ncbi:hypothetical protein A3K78_00070 [Candidatus Bathyarchaeota archaeon RBG_13_52_12]|nr:MAG: hypothetical protein A3K78_00070 [Candidatus Bathyarchaeota archaeon RBG_13_52_12]